MIAVPISKVPPADLRKRLLARSGALTTEASTWLDHWSDVGRHLLPRSGRFTPTDRNRTGRDRYNAIYDSTATRALRVLGAGMMAGATSPARPWFRLTTPDPDLSEFYAVRIWLDDVAKRMHGVFQRANTYRSLHQGYEELGCFGTQVELLLPDRDRVVHHYPIPMGQFRLQIDYQGRVNTLYRLFQKSVGELVREFGLDNCSAAVRDLYKNRTLEAPVDLLHVIEPRADAERTMESPLAVDMPWRSVYIELASEDNKILRESGFLKFPVLAPRWSVSGDDVYGISPGMDSLGDIRQLQQEQLRKGQGIDYQTRPTLQVPSTLKERDLDALPGGISYYEPGMMLPFDQVSPNAGIRTAFEVNLNLDHLLIDIQDVRQRIRENFFADLFLMLANAGPNTRMTATEVAERHEEKLLMLGPVLERLHNEKLQPMIDLTFDAMAEQGLLPPPPQELQGVELSVEFVSILAQAQQAIGANGIDRFVGSALQIAALRPDVLDKVNFDKWADKFSRMMGVDADLVVDDKDVQALRKARANAQAQQDKLAAMQQVAGAAKDASAAGALPSTGDVPEGDALSQLTGYTAPAGVPGP